MSEGYSRIVMKFGGASVKDAASIKNVAKILESYSSKSMVVVVSAMDKTTNQLERLSWLARDQKEAEAWERLGKIRAFHLNIAIELFGALPAELDADLKRYFGEMENIIRGILLLQDFPPRTYDRIVSYGELISSSILFHFLKRSRPQSFNWIDARDLIKTDASFTQAQVIWTITQDNIERRIGRWLKNPFAWITQGFIASSLEGKITTLGREGSDYTAAIFANCLDADRMIVWKDVAGVLSADPRRDSNAVKLDSLSSLEAVEMTWFGATVIHPKTIKPLFEKNISLEVKCFLDPEAEGTLISRDISGHHPAAQTCTIVKGSQALVTILPRDISFMQPSLLAGILQSADRAGLQVNLVQTTAVALILCVNEIQNQIEEFSSLLLDEFEVSVDAGKTLVTRFPILEVNAGEVKDAVLVQQAGDKLFVVRNA